MSQKKKGKNVHGRDDDVVGMIVAVGISVAYSLP